MAISKDALAKKFTAEWKKHYDVAFLRENGFTRRQCTHCKRHFWSLNPERAVCADSSCMGFAFIGHPTKKLGYVETWRKIARYFEKNGHTEIARYPTVCRWRTDLYFTNASIIDFQPYVVTGEIEPPENPLIVPQPSIRFGDIENVGVTGVHYSSFVMFGQHAFNSQKTGLFYWKDEALEHDYNYITKVLGAKKEAICFQEDVWAGGGTFGPCIEYCVDGLELGNCVFMQFKELPGGKYEELKTKVIDMGAGLERLAWFTQGTPSSYDITFGDVLTKMKKRAGIKVDNKLYARFACMAGLLDVDGKNLKEMRGRVARELGVEEEELFSQVRPIQALYASADHLKTLLMTVTDGMLPSNAGGGYNLRMLLRRVFGFEDEFNLNLYYAKIVEGHARFLKDLDPVLEEGVDSTIEVIEEERKKYAATKQKGRKIVSGLLEEARTGRKIQAKKMVALYTSHGIPVEVLQDEAAKQNLPVEVPDNFYQLAAHGNEVKKEKKKTGVPVEKYKATRTLYYENPYQTSFSATVLGVEGKAVILDKTCFYPEGGGQVGDTGKINGIKVADTQKVEGVVLHFAKDAKKFKKGQKVRGEIDAVRRRRIMHHHTATHLLNAATRSLLGRHVWQAGALKTALKAHLDITHYKRLTPEELFALEQQVNKYIQQNIPVSMTEMPRDQAEKEFGFGLYQGGYVPGKKLRIVNIKDTDVEACGGTHVKNTGEIGFFKILKRESIQDGVERITYACGVPALKHIREHEKLLQEAAAAFSVPVTELPKTAQRFFTEWKQLKRQVEGLSRAAASAVAQKLSQRKESVVHAYLEGLSQESLLPCAKEAAKKAPEKAFVLGVGTRAVAMSGAKSGKDARDLLAAVMKKAGGRGGGSPQMARGAVKDAGALKRALS